MEEIKTKKVAKFNQEWIDNAKEFLRDIENNEITHGAVIYRKRDGSVVFRRFAEDHKTYLMGLMLKGAIRLANKDEWEENDLVGD